MSRQPAVNGGSRIVFASSVDVTDVLDIYVMNADGSGQTRLTDNAGSDSQSDWSPVP